MDIAVYFRGRIIGPDNLWQKEKSRQAAK